jgi:NADH-quinone oxidoreductase subunit L
VSTLALWIPLLPLLSAAAIAVISLTARGGDRTGARRAVPALAVLPIAAAAVLTFVVLFGHGTGAATESQIRYAATGGPEIWLGARVDGLAALIAVLVGVVATAVQLYSVSYMAHEERYTSYAALISLFTAAMLVVVYSTDLLVLLVGWEVMGACSYFLIGHHWERPEARSASIKAFLVTKLGDAPFLLGILFLAHGAGTFRVQPVLQHAIQQGGHGYTAAGAILLIGGVMGKSAQIPLQTWLPDAMAGPTPISALIHAATMVAAGVYLLVRTYALLAVAPQVSLAVAVVGVATALGASVASLFQTNFKKGIAYSTVAQLGYMFAGVGVGAPFAGLFHLFTHASFKALLFLAAGIVIHGAGGRESLAALRGLGRFFPFNSAGFLIGALALIGTPLVTAGSFSKDAIIDAALSRQPIIGYLLLGGVILTGLYIGRLFSIVYVAPPVDEHAVHHDPESERPMNWSLVPLMVGAVAFGYLGTWLQARLAAPSDELDLLPGPITPIGLIAFALGAIGFGIAWWYATRRAEAVAPAPSEPSYAAAGWVHAIAEVGYAVSDGLRRVQSGALATYAFGSFLALAIIMLAREVTR